MNREYIERRAALEALDDLISNIAFSSPYQDDISTLVSGMERARDCVENIPAADTVEMKYGQLVDVVDFGNGVCFGYCSICGTEHRADNRTHLISAYRHCRWCGSKLGI